MPSISLEGLAVGVLDDGVVKLAAADEVDGAALVERFVGVGGDGRSDEGDLDVGVGVFDLLRPLLVAGPGDGAGEEDEELVVLEDCRRPAAR